jgi:hypothetical protein
MINDKITSVLNYSRWLIATSFIMTAWWVGLIGVSNASESTPLKLTNNSQSLSSQVSIYRTECEACHLAYPAKLLPANSWSIIMTQLDEHFGENAELDTDMAADITKYLMSNAGAEGRGMLKRITDPAPLRITDLPSFVRKHDEVPDRLVTGNPDVGSFSNCNVCHEGAVKGDFDEDRINIPGYGRWDD